MKRSYYGHVQVPVTDPDRHWAAEVDAGVVEDILLLWRHGIRTRFSCEALPDGLGRRARQIVLTFSADIAAAVELLPWARSAEVNSLGYASITSIDMQGCGNWKKVWGRECAAT